MAVAPHHTNDRDISILDAARLNLHIVTVSNYFPSDGHFAVHRNIHHHKPGQFGIYFNHTRIVSQTKPASRSGAFFNHHTTEHDLRGCDTTFDRQHAVWITFWRFAQNFP